MIAKLETRTRQLLDYAYGSGSVTEAVFSEEVELLDGSTFFTSMVAKRIVGGIRLVFTLLRNGKSAIYANAPGENQGGYHYLMGEYAMLFGGSVRDTDWETGSFTIVIDV
jgi:hypothetical protein